MAGITIAFDDNLPQFGISLEETVVQNIGRTFAASFATLKRNKYGPRRLAEVEVLL
jgi:hypothetical protein